MSLTEREIRTNATTLVAAGLWSLSLVVWLLGWILDARYVGILSLLLCGAAVTATVRGYFIEQTEQIRRAFLVTGRGDPDVRPLR